jgi:hypothetical protein
VAGARRIRPRKAGLHAAYASTPTICVSPW